MCSVDNYVCWLSSFSCTNNGSVHLHVIRHMVSFLPPARCYKTVGGNEMGSVAVSAVYDDILPYISVAIKASFLKFNMYSIYKNSISKMFLFFLN